MDWLENAKKLVSPNYVMQASQQHNANEKKINLLLKTQALPETEPWNDELIKNFMSRCSLLDTNNYPNNTGVGEREGRILSQIVRQRHFSLAHGIGRSGDIAADQPKAIGSSIIYQITNKLALQTLRIAGAKSTKKCIVIPMATGMTLSLALRTVAYKRPNSKYVIWSRIDQKTCLKSIFSTGFQPIVVEGNLINGHVSTNLEGIEQKLKEVKNEEIVCVLTTTSCFSPRAPDKIIEVAQLCKKYKVPHLINNAYGAQSLRIMANIDSAQRKGRVDGYIQSTDKNYMVPVGGAIIASKNKNFIDECAQMYPGRASISPILDLFLTLLNFSQKSYKEYLKGRQKLMDTYFRPQIQKVAEKFGEKIIENKKNPISLAMTLNNQKGDPKNVGAKLFYRKTTGPRVVKRKTKKEVMSCKFENYGSHHSQYPYDVIVMSCAVGINKEMIDKFVIKLEKILKDTTKPEFIKKC